MSFVDRSRRELESGSHVIGRQLRVLRDDAVRGKTLGDQPHDGGDRNARAGDARHAAHDAVIGHDSVSRHVMRVSSDGSSIWSVDCRRSNSTAASVGRECQQI